MEEIENELEIYKTQLNEYIVQVGWSADDAYVIAGSASGELVFIKGEEESEIKIAESHKNGLINLSVHPKKNIVTTAGQDGKIALWDIEKAQQISDLIVGKGWVDQAKWSPDGKYLAVANQKTIHIFDSDLLSVRVVDTHASSISDMQWKYDSKAIATASYKFVHIIDLLSKENAKQLPWQSSMVSLAWSPDGKFICTGTQDNSVHIWPAPFRAAQDSEMSGYPGKIKSMVFDARSNYLATNCMNTIILWKFAGKVPHGQKPMELKAHAGKVTAMAYQHKGKILVTGDELGYVLFWMPEKNKEFITGAQLQGAISCISISHDDGHVVCGTAEGMVVIMEMPE